MSWLDQDSEASSGRRQSVEEDVARHLRWTCYSGVLALAVAVMAAATATARSFVYFVIPFIVSCFFTGWQWMEWRRAKRLLAAAPEAGPESNREVSQGGDVPLFLLRQIASRCDAPDLFAAGHRGRARSYLR